MTPQLRFPEFTDEWQVKKIGDTGNVITGSTPITADRTLYGSEYQFISPGDMNSGRYVISTKQRLSQKGFDISRKIKTGSTLFVCIGSTIGKTAQVREMSVTNQQINAVVTNDNHDDDFVYLALSKISTKIALSAGAQAVPIISKSDFSKNIIHIPSKPEQEKIADFLTAVDERIAVGEKKLELLETYKRGVMQKIFSQAIRFKDANGNDYPDWHEKKLGEIVGIKSGNSKSEHIARNGRNVIVDMGAISSNATLIDTKRTNFSGDFIEMNELIMAKDDIGGGNIIGKVVMVPERNKFVLGDHVYKLKPHAVNTKFLYYAINSPVVNREFRKKANGTAQIGITNGTVANQAIDIPCKEEQQKIADFLATLDDKITAEKSKLTAAKQFKKALLQRMFV